MTAGIKKGEPDPKVVYADIMDFPHWEPGPAHPRMTLYNRSAQFAPFAALSGYDDMVAEEARQIDNRIELSEEDMALMDRKLNVIGNAISAGRHPAVTVTRFVPDPLKAGGKYVTTEEEIRRIDLVKGKLILSRTQGNAGSYMEINIPDILDLQGEGLDDLE